MSSCKFCECFKKNCFYRTPPVAASFCLLVIYTLVFICFWDNYFQSTSTLQSTTLITAGKVFVFGVFLVRIFLYSDWIWRDTLYLSVFKPNAVKCGPDYKQKIFFSLSNVKFLILAFQMLFSSYRNEIGQSLSPWVLKTTGIICQNKIDSWWIFWVLVKCCLLNPVLKVDKNYRQPSYSS